MRATAFALLLAPALLAGCTAPEDAADGEATARLGPALHTTDCTLAPDGDTCRRPTERTPLEVGTWPAGNRSRVGILVGDSGNGTLRFDGAPPALWLYSRGDDGTWSRVAVVAGGPAPGAEVGPGETLNLTLHYGRIRPTDRANDLAWDEPYAPEPWPPRVYRACLSAHLDGSAGWVRGCEDFRIVGPRGG